MTCTAHNPALFCATFTHLHRQPAWRAFWMSYQASDYGAGGDTSCE